MEYSGVTFQSEKVKDVLGQIEPLLVEHYNETYPYKDVALKPDLEIYFSMERLHALRLYTVRDRGELIGYSTFFLKKHIHHSASLQAWQDLLFIARPYRGHLFLRFIDFWNEQLSGDGVEVIYCVANASKDFGKVLARKGYVFHEIIYSKRYTKKGEG